MSSGNYVTNKTKKKGGENYGITVEDTADIADDSASSPSVHVDVLNASCDVSYAS